ncbi:MAG: peroxidase-related enzyme [Acidobacteria bacterium]|nr:peroxidase-related enzyme [Acidobacteriota bacterium]MBI3663904.1 peroxidase-related enzyme [Acidobacteriota bacterium]
MSFIPQINEQEASGATARVYEDVRKAYGKVPNFYAVQGTRPDVIGAEMALGGNIMKDEALPRAVKEKIALVVSGINHSSYCIAAHSEALHNLGVAKPLARQLSIDYPSAPASEAEMALFHFADKLTRQPGEIAQADVDGLRRHGWNDGQIYEAALATAWFNFVNRISAGLGLILDF